MTNYKELIDLGSEEWNDFRKETEGTIDLTGVNFSQKYFMGYDFSNCIFGNSNVYLSFFGECNFTNSIFINAIISSSNFFRCDFINCDFGGSYISCNLFEVSNFSGSIYDKDVPMSQTPIQIIGVGYEIVLILDQHILCKKQVTSFDTYVNNIFYDNYLKDQRPFILNAIKIRENKGEAKCVLYPLN